MLRDGTGKRLGASPDRGAAPWALMNAACVVAFAMGPGFQGTVAASEDAIIAAARQSLELVLQGRIADARRKAESGVQLAEAQLRSDLGRTHRDLVLEVIATSLTNLATIQNLQCDFLAAEASLKRSIDILSPMAGARRDAFLGGNYLHLAEVSKDMGQHSRAFELCLKAIELLDGAKGVLDEKTETLCRVQSRSLLAKLLRRQKRDDEARRQLEWVVRIGESSATAGNLVSEALRLLAGLEIDAGRLDEARKLCERALAGDRRAHRDSPMLVMGSIEALAKVLILQGRPAEAEPLLREAAGIQEVTLGMEHSSAIDLLSQQAEVARRLGRPADAAAFHERARRLSRRFVKEILPGLSLVEQESFLLQTDRLSLRSSMSFGWFSGDDPAIASASFAWLANGKAMAQEASAELARLMHGSDDPKVAVANEELIDVRRELARLSQLQPKPGQLAGYRERRTDLESRQRSLLREVGTRVAGDTRDDPWVTTDAIRGSIGSGAVLVDVALLDGLQTRPGDAKSSDRYVAWLVQPEGSKPVSILDLGDVGETDAAIARLRSAIAAADDSWRVPAEAVSKALFGPVLEAIGRSGRKVSEIVISPDGALWLVPWAALTLDDGRFAVESFTIRTISSSRELAQPLGREAAPTAPTAPIVLADPDYNATLSGLAGTLATLGMPPVAGSSGASRSAGPRFSRRLPAVEGLPETRGEASIAMEGLEKRFGKPAELFLGQAAQEAVIKRKAMRPAAIVLATHGYSLAPLTAGVDPRAATEHADPLLDCGVLLAGANRAHENRPEGFDDGVLTGTEVAVMDLSGSELVVLSACDTGVGKSWSGEGVMSLRQAFRLAGARHVIATLWQIPDAESAKLMGQFYRALGSGQPVPEALREAQVDFIEDARKGTDPNAISPYFWASYGVTGI